MLHRVTFGVAAFMPGVSRLPTVTTHAVVGLVDGLFVRESQSHVIPTGFRATGRAAIDVCAS